MRTENHPARRSYAVGEFGEKLRKHREQRGIALDAISNTTKISTRMLRAIEEEHFDQLPGGVFNKGFVRAYARGRPQRRGGCHRLPKCPARKPDRSPDRSPKLPRPARQTVNQP